MPLSPFDWTGPAFLTLYVVLLIAATIWSIVASSALRPMGRDRSVSDPAQLALLAGGRTRWADMVVAGRLAAGELVMTGQRFATASGADLSWSELSRSLVPQAEGNEAALRRAGLLAQPDEIATLRRWSAGPFLALAAFGTIKLVVGILRDRPVGFLVGLLVLTLLLAAIRGAAVDRRTVAGKDALRRARDNHARLRRAPTRDETALGVALFGTAILAGSAFAPFHRLRAGTGDGGVTSDSGGGDGGGGGGCGGGGCGGCGS